MPDYLISQCETVFQVWPLFDQSLDPNEFISSPCAVLLMTEASDNPRCQKMQARQEKMRIGLMVTCLVDVMRPEIGLSAIKLLEAAGCEVVVPEAQTCCGQPAYSAGYASTFRQNFPRDLSRSLAFLNYV
jgi:Fe-S oxidoreductase